LYNQGHQSLNNLSFVKNIKAYEIKDFLEVRYYRRVYPKLELKGLDRQERLKVLRNNIQKEKFEYINSKSNIDFDDPDIFERILWKLEKFNLHPIDNFNFEELMANENNLELNLKIFIKKYRINMDQYGFITVISF
jgi:hypothetical protein